MRQKSDMMEEKSEICTWVRAPSAGLNSSILLPERLRAWSVVSLDSWVGMVGRLRLLRSRLRSSVSWRWTRARGLEA